MNIVLDIGYNIVGRRPGRTVGRAYRFRETVSVPIQEIQAHAAPIAVSWNARMRIEERWRYFDNDIACGDANGQMMTRWHAGRHWLRLVEGSCGKSGAANDLRELTPDAAASATQKKRNEPYDLLGLSKFIPENAKEHPNPTETFEEIVRDERDVALQAVAAISDNFISIGGVLHALCAQPGIRVADSGRIRGRKQFEENIAIDMRTKRLEGSSSYLAGLISYPIYDWDQVHRKVYQQALDSGASRPERQLMSPEIHIPESIDPEIEARRAVDTLVKKTFFTFQVFSTSSDRRIMEFFDSEARQRLGPLEELLDQRDAVLSRPDRNDLIQRVGEIEDGMSVDIEIAPKRSTIEP